MGGAASNAAGSPPAGPQWIGFYGYVEWPTYFDWWLPTT
jgi:hypothetical protein